MTRARRTIRLLVAAFVTVFVTLPLAAALGAVCIAWTLGKLPKDDPTKWPTLIGVVLLLVGSAALVRRLLRGVLASGPAGPRDPRGLLERFADRHPTWFSRVLSLNGFGLRRLDFHDRRDDGSVLATVWVTLAFLPVAPVRCERVRPGPDAGAFFFVAWWSRRQVEIVERVPLPAARNRAVLLAYWLGFLPAIVGPTFAGLAYAVVARPGPETFWPGAAAVFVLGVLTFAIEERLGATPPRRVEPALRD